VVEAVEMVGNGWKRVEKGGKGWQVSAHFWWVVGDHPAILLL